jgi:cell division protein FtsI/penicillin-binding protein 2
VSGSRSHRVAAVLAALALAGGLLVACSGSKGSPEKTAAQNFLDRVGAGDAPGAAALTSDPEAAQQALHTDLTGLGSGAKGSLRVSAVHTKDATSTADFTASWTLPGASSPWRYTGQLPLTKNGSQWHVTWAASDLHPGLTDATHLAVRRVQPARGGLEFADGTPILTSTPVVSIGIEPKLVTDLNSLARTLAAIPQLQSTAAEITAAVKGAPGPTAFVPVITLRRSVYDQIRDRVHDLPGTVFQESTELLGPAAHFAQPLLGNVGPATAEVVAKSHGRVVAGDDTGLGGLQQALDQKLAGTPAVNVLAVNADGSTAKTLATVSPSAPGTAVRLTIDRATQQAAESALSGVRQAASIVAVQRSTGRILADANSATATYDLGLAGAFPAGSTFKLATWTAAFTAKPALLPSSTVPCPATTTVDGRVFENENKFSYPPVPISSAFGYSCNTSAIQQAMSLPSDAVGKAARQLGLGATWTLPVTSFSGALPPPAGATEQAADAIGQGKVQVSPLLMALIAGAASSGTPVLPSLLGGATTQKGTPLPAALTDKMNALMKATVSLPQGTGHALADIPGVEGKTGTAEYGNAAPPRSHAWFAGVRGDVAFAVFVYDGASAGVSPVTVSHAFLSALG